MLYSGGNDAAVKIIQNIDWKRYGVSDAAPLAICSHICSTRVPYDSVAKEQVASTEEIDREIKLAVLELGRKLSIYLKRRHSQEKAAKRVSVIEKYLKATAEFGAVLAGNNSKVPSIQGLCDGSIIGTDKKPKPKEEVSMVI